ncbi:hypothetical protein TWF718_010558 [Orbilia javanica]|uniref:Uncharacterized protein n=1 Tax=Orbilia javanica TaxID=47235 RepID=A0AAN8MPF1_9PEZI
MSTTINNHDVQMSTTEAEEVLIYDTTGSAPNTPERPKTPVQLQREEEEEDRDPLHPSDKDEDDEDDDSGYWTGRKRIRISVNKYKSRRSALQVHEGDRLVFDRISPTSKYYKTIFIPSDKPVNRVLFPKVTKRKNPTTTYQEQEKIQPEDNKGIDDLDEFSSDLEAKKNSEPEDIYDALTPYRHTWTDSDLVALYVLRRW